MMNIKKIDYSILFLLLSKTCRTHLKRHSQECSTQKKNMKLRFSCGEMADGTTMAFHRMPLQHAWL